MNESTKLLRAGAPKYLLVGDLGVSHCREANRRSTGDSVTYKLPIGANRHRFDWRISRFCLTNPTNDGDLQRKLTTFGWDLEPHRLVRSRLSSAEKLHRLFRKFRKSWTSMHR